MSSYPERIDIKTEKDNAMATAKQNVEKTKADNQSIKENEKKWGKPLMDAGWICLPNTIVLRQQALGLDPVDMNILLVILAHWWQADNMPFPSKKLIADTIGMDMSTVRRRLAKLEGSGMIERILRPQPGARHKSNIYKLTGLITGATPLAVEELATRSDRAVQRAKRATKKGLAPPLKLVTK